MDVVALLIQLVAGATGGNIAGSLLRRMSLGPIGNTIAGMVGGGIGNVMLNGVLGPGQVAALAVLDPGAVIGEIAAAGVGGGVMMVLVGLLRQALSN